MPSEIECRANQSAVECRSGGQRRIGGLAAVFGTPSQLLPGGFTEIVDPQAFSASRQTGYAGVICTYEHRDLLGSIKGRTLRLEVTTRGLDYECDLVASRSDVLELASRGDLSSSFAFSVNGGGDSWSHREGYPVRTLHSVSLRDVSAVSTPAYLAADVGLRSLAAYVQAPLADVTRYAQNGSLSKFFTRTDRPGYRGRRPLTRQQREVELMRVRWPEDRAKPLTRYQREVELMRVRWPEDCAKPLTPKQREVELMRVRWPEDRAKPLTSKQKQLETMRMRWPEDCVTECMNPLWLD